MRKLRLENITKSYSGEIILDNLSLEIAGGQFFALLGPSGCGKTSILRLIAGLEPVDHGEIYLGKTNITNVPIYERKINTVFQNYALFPHLSVFDNVAYALRVRGIASDEVEARVYDMLKIVRLSEQAHKSIFHISGGQQQRVALARALVAEPAILLLDEPLAALDKRLKEQMLTELIDLQERLGTTFVYVTHDQDEALTVASRMAIMNNQGKIEQISSPKNVYEFPISRFVANFVGKTNIIQGILHRNDDEFTVDTEHLGSITVFTPQEKNWMIAGCHAFMSIRPEKIKITKKHISGMSNTLQGTVQNIIYYGRSTLYDIEIAEQRIIKVFKQNAEHIPQEVIGYDETVNLYFHKEDVILLEN